MPYDTFKPTDVGREARIVSFVFSWESLFGATLDPISAVASAPGRIDLFVRGTDDVIWTKRFDGVWEPGGPDWTSLGGQTHVEPTAVSWGANRVDVFVTGTNGAVYHKWRNGIDWFPSIWGWESLGGEALGPVSAVATGANELDLFVRGTDDALYHKRWDGSEWLPSASGWEPIGGSGRISAHPVAVTWGAHTIDIFGVGTDHAVHHKWWDGSRWGPGASGDEWEPLGGETVGPVSAMSGGHQPLDLFMRGLDYTAHHKWWDGSQWRPSESDWESLGLVVTAPPGAVSRDPTEGLDVFVNDLGGTVQTQQIADLPDPTPGWLPLGGEFVGPISAVSWGPGRIDIFCTDTEKAIRHLFWSGFEWGPTTWEEWGPTAAPT
jgi:hypothetical protein